MSLNSHWRFFMMAIGLAAAGCSGEGPEDSTVDEGASREHAEQLTKGQEDQPGVVSVPVCGDGICSKNEDCGTCVSDCGACGGACGHDLCMSGSSLDEACDPCVADVCAVDSFCCDQLWDTTCVNEAVTICGQTCAPVCGDYICDANGGESCGSCAADCGACPTCGDGVCASWAGESCQSCSADCGACGGSCDHDKCTFGPWIAANCDPCVAAVCAVDPFCCTSYWDSYCINEVQTVCGDPSCAR